jgi:hypothetical protein
MRSGHLLIASKETNGDLHLLTDEARGEEKVRVSSHLSGLQELYRRSMTFFSALNLALLSSLRYEAKEFVSSGNWAKASPCPERQMNLQASPTAPAAELSRLGGGLSAAGTFQSPVTQVRA